MSKNDVQSNKDCGENPFAERVGRIFKGKYRHGDGSFAAKLVATKNDTLIFEFKSGLRFLVDYTELAALYEVAPRRP